MMTCLVDSNVAAFPLALLLSWRRGGATALPEYRVGSKTMCLNKQEAFQTDSVVERLNSL
jgi:hypothetical protein